LFAQAGLSELFVDNFCGGGGVSTGIEQAIRRPVDIAVNHSEDAIRMHRTNRQAEIKDVNKKARKRRDLRHFR